MTSESYEYQILVPIHLYGSGYTHLFIAAFTLRPWSWVAAKLLTVWLLEKEFADSWYKWYLCHFLLQNDRLIEKFSHFFVPTSDVFCRCVKPYTLFRDCCPLLLALFPFLPGLQYMCVVSSHCVLQRETSPQIPAPSSEFASPVGFGPPVLHCFICSLRPSNMFKKILQFFSLFPMGGLVHVA